MAVTDINLAKTETSRKLRLFLAHSSNDKPIVRTLYQRLLADGFNPWSDEDVLPGQNWEGEIEKAVTNSDVVIICLSRSSVTKEGFVQREIRLVLDWAEEKPEKSIFLIPLKLEESNVPESLSNFQWVDYYKERGYERLTRALRFTAKQLGLVVEKPEPAPTPAAPDNIELNALSRMELRRILDTRYSLEEIRELTFDLMVDYEALSGDTKSSKARELIAYMERRGRLLELELILTGQQLKEAVYNPYTGHSGRPVTPPNFVGREDIIREIHRYWQGDGELPPIILYGHRRMGKTSILRNLNPEKNPNIILTLLDMQDVALVDNTGQLLYGFATAIQQQAKVAGLEVGPNFDIAKFSTTGQARLQMNQLLEKLDSQMQQRRFILAVDEFEKIQNKILEGKIEADVLDYLRAINQKYGWLGLIFAGLHELEEMGRDYQRAFYGSAKNRRVSYLSREAARRLITQKGNDKFKLEYNQDLIDEIYRLTNGQPYITQLICYQLVENWNERAENSGYGIRPRLTVKDLVELLNDQFYEGDADYYFQGVWGQVTSEIEKKILVDMARWQEQNKKPEDELPLMDYSNIGKITGLAGDELKNSLKNLERRDVISKNRDGKISFSSEIMRLWIMREATRKEAWAREAQEV